ncbi:transcriptional regulator [Paenibacillus sambharensis]|uniref:Transcriptional regulator n=1 Tax=Paenibacillus sambharensis TaxID=1803190 RepID=A0A2W1L352_9BACL|nr:MerR family transcriptional regulator [Paenibacillus sambharensis]PZD93766.1 transcriptional regulator [Paenibacillus sambharensis]
MTINEVAKRLNISRRSIRFYEEKGLIAPGKERHNQYRVFTEQDVWRLQTIAALREVGMGLDDIKRVLGPIEAGNKDELLNYLELQRSVMFSAWLEYKQQIEAAEQMIGILRQQEALPLQEIYKLAEGSRRLRELRNNWSDQWDFDSKAAGHDHSVREASGPFGHYDEVLETVYRWINPKAGETGLDIGTGTGNLAGRFIREGIGMAAVDQSREMLRQFRVKYPELESKLGNFLAIPYMDREFDFAVSSYAFHHLNEGQQLLALEEIRRVLKPKGRICLAGYMVEDDEARERAVQHSLGGGHAGLMQALQGGYVPQLSRLSDWFEEHGYMTKQKQLSDVLHIICAVPIR